MGTNLIQNYIAKPANQQKPVTQPQAPAKPIPDFNIQHELDNRTFIKPLRGKGRLLTGNILSSPKYTFDNFIYSMKALKHAATGNANDHELGKLNDLGLMGGGLAIASYLTTKRYTPMTKGMEFVGFGAFIASMALWPKIAIQLPAYLIHGVNVQQKYQDSFGRKKPFYQDPQFIPWDLYSDKQIDKIGDRLGVDKDMPNRRDFIQEKMRKLAVQNNTLWMLTAGFATPVMTALICNATEPYLINHMNNIRNKKADKILSNVEEYSKKYQDKHIEKKLEAVFKQHQNKPIDNNIYDALVEAFTDDLDAVTMESFKKDLKALIDNGEYNISETTAKNISKNIKQQFEKQGYSKEFIEAVIPTEDAMVNLFKENQFIKSTKAEGFNKIVKAIALNISQRAIEFNQLHPDDAEDLKHIRNILTSQATEKHPIFKELYSLKANTFDENLFKTLQKAAQAFDGFRARLLTLDEYALIKAGSAPETVIANYWNDVSKDLIKIFGITDKELEKARFDKNLMGKLLREKLEKIVSDRASYEKVMNTLVEKIASLNSKIKSSDMTSHMLKGDIGKSEKTAYESAVDTVFRDYSQKINTAGFTRTSRALTGSGGDEFGSAKAIQKAFVEERLLGVKSSFFRLINTLDFYRRVATDPNAFRPYNEGVPRGVMEELIELCKIITLEGHSSDSATKFYMLRNPNPEADFSPLEVENGRIKNAHLGKAPKGTTDIPNDKYFFQNAMKFMFGDDMHPETKSILERSIIKDEMTNYRHLVMDKIGGEKYFWKPRHIVSNTGDTGSDIKFLLTGISPNELVYKTGQQVFNSKKWLKIFGGIGAGLLGVTVLIQFFLGRLKAPQGGNK